MANQGIRQIRSSREVVRNGAETDAFRANAVSTASIMTASSSSAPQKRRAAFQIGQSGRKGDSLFASKYTPDSNYGYAPAYSIER